MHGQGLPRPTLAITCATDDNNNNGDVTTMMIGHNDDDADVFPQSRKVAANAAPPLSRGQRLAVLKAATRQCCHHVRWVPLSPGTQAATIHGALHLHMGHCAHALCAIKRLRNAGHV